MKYAIIKNDIVDNVIEADQEFVDLYYPGAILLNNESIVGPGYKYENGNFIEPEIVIVELPVEE